MAAPTTTPTAVAVPSKEPQDLLFNAEFFDIAMAGDQLTIVDRRGQTHRTYKGAIQSLMATNPRGAWSATPSPADYALKDLVVVSSVVYICTVPHTPSALFATDLAAGRWAVHQGVTSADLALPGAAARINTADGRSAQSHFDDLIQFDTFLVGATVNEALAAARAYINARVVTPDAAGPAVIPTLYIRHGTYALTADAELPPRVICDGRFTGAYKLTLTRQKRANIVGLSCATLEIDGLWFGHIADLRATTALVVKGGGVGFGTFWNKFSDIIANVTIDLSNWSVNQNTFHGRGDFRITGSGADALDGHMNNTDNWDATGGTFLNDSSPAQTNTLRGAYYEGGSDIRGNFHVDVFHGDALGPPKVGRDNQILNSSNSIERNRGDFLAASLRNVLVGGEWDRLDGSGKPVCLTSNGGTTIATDTTEPFGIGQKFGGVFNVAFAGFTITIPPVQTARFCLTLAYQSTDNFANISVTRGGGGGTTDGADSVVVIDSVNNWKLLRITGNASTTNNTTVLLQPLVAAGSKTFYIGGMFATQEKTAFLPAPKPLRKHEGNTLEAHGVYTQWGTVGSGYVAGTSVDLTITYPKAFSSAPRLTYSAVENDPVNSPKFTKMMTLDPSTSGVPATTGAVVRVYFPADWAGGIHWQAIGPA